MRIFEKLCTRFVKIWAFIDFAINCFTLSKVSIKQGQIQFSNIVYRTASDNSNLHTDLRSICHSGPGKMVSPPLSQADRGYDFPA